MIAFRWWRNLRNLLPKRPSPCPNGNAPKTSGLLLGGGGGGGGGAGGGGGGGGGGGLVL